MANSAPTDHPEETLRRIRTFVQFIDYLVEVQRWPDDLVDLLDDEDLSAITYDWDPGELGIPENQVPALNRFQQMRPITADQPWGVFFLEFTGSRLPRTQVRRLLRPLVHRKRASSGGSNPTWNLNDLLFVVITGSDDPVELHLLAFDGESSANAQFKALSWYPAQSPDRHLRRLNNELLPNLAWPVDENDTETWRQEWRKAFKLRQGQAISDAARLAERMSHTARDLRIQIRDVLRTEEVRGGGGG